VGTVNALQGVAARWNSSAVGGGAARECGAYRVGEGLVAPPRSILSADAGFSGQSHASTSRLEEQTGARSG
jgi:hypothetical protein